MQSLPEAAKKQCCHLMGYNSNSVIKPNRSSIKQFLKKDPRLDNLFPNLSFLNPKQLQLLCQIKKLNDSFKIKRQTFSKVFPNKEDKTIFPNLATCNLSSRLLFYA